MFKNSRKLVFPIQNQFFYLENNENILKIINTYKTDKKYKIILNPLGTYVKYRQKRNNYIQLYNRNRLFYYSKIYAKLVSKFFRKKLPIEMKTMMLNCFLFYCLGNTGIITKIVKKFKK